MRGKNFVIEYRSADVRIERFPDLAAELVRLKVDLIVTRGTPAALAAKNATETIPVVMMSVADPLIVVDAIARPGANVTGLYTSYNDLEAKRVELLKDALPSLARIAVFANMGNPAVPVGWNNAEKAGRSLGIEVQLLEVRRPEDIGPAFDAASRQRADALVVFMDSVM